jgi:hypothetical protein
MSNTVLILSKEFMTRINVALGEIQAKFAIPVINEMQAWADKAEQEPHKLLADIEAHLAPVKAKVDADKAAAEARVLAEVKAVQDAKSAVAEAL